MSQELRQQSMNKNCLFELFRKHVKSGNLKRFKNLLEIHQISPTEIRTNSNTTLLHIAALYNKPKIATFLMNSGLSIHEQNSKNYCPYFLAVLHNSKRVMRCMER
ncbi:hypothetical protein NEIRO03_1249 [Nematocida sp. AWRm78]|nr:hypothetical protein NEIRO02_1344 [Nematocida sp. AWRm79]KAI5183670.1 hypothetical protein NEIRO03_1249 [Nematocida sp. AWRm78]